MELTITQNGALYFTHHKVPVPKRRAALFWPFRTAASNKHGPAETKSYAISTNPGTCSTKRKKQ